MTSTLDRLKATTVFISGPDGTGTGYLVSPDRVATANHVVRSWGDGVDYIVIVGVDGVIRKARVLKRDLETDAALLRLDSPVDVIPFPIGTGLVRNVVWDGYGFPQSGVRVENPPGLPLDGLIKDPATRNNVGQPAVLLYSDMAAAGNASPLNGFSGSAVVVADTLIGHLTKHIGDVNDLSRPRYGYVFACPITAVAALFDFTPRTIPVRATIASSIADDCTLEQYRSVYVGLAVEALRIEVTDGRVEELTHLFRSLKRELKPLLCQDEMTVTSKIDSYTDGHATRAAKVRRRSAQAEGEKRGGTITENLKSLGQQVNTLRQKIQQGEALAPPYKPTQDRIPQFSDIPQSERAFHQQRLDEHYRLQLAQYDRATDHYKRVKDELPKVRQELSQIERDIAQRRIELNNFNQSLDFNLSQLDREIEVARGQDIVQHLSGLRDRAKQDLHDGAGAPRGFAQLLICNAGAIVLRPWTGNSYSGLETVVKDVDALLKRAVQAYPVDLALDCLSRCQAVLQTLERNRATLEKIGTELERASKRDIERALSGVRELRALPLPPFTPPKANALFPNDYDQLFRTIDAATTQIGSVRERWRRQIELNADALKGAKLGMDAAAQLQSTMANEELRVKELFDDLSFVWVDLCTHERRSMLPSIVIDFLTAIDNEVRRRHSLTIAALVERCASTRFLLKDAETRIENATSAVLLREHQELSTYFRGLDELAENYATAKKNVTESSKGLLEKFWRYFK